MRKRAHRKPLIDMKRLAFAAPVERPAVYRIGNRPVTATFGMDQLRDLLRPWWEGSAVIVQRLQDDSVLYTFTPKVHE